MHCIALVRLLLDRACRPHGTVAAGRWTRPRRQRSIEIEAESVPLCPPVVGVSRGGLRQPGDVQVGRRLNLQAPFNAPLFAGLP
jgi:hypothetical protein